MKKKICTLVRKNLKKEKMYNIIEAHKRNEEEMT